MNMAYINFFDTAKVYNKGESERIVGKGLKGRRDEIILATKVRGHMGENPNNAGLSCRNILSAADASLKRLDTDYIDIYIVHFIIGKTGIFLGLSRFMFLGKQSPGNRVVDCHSYIMRFQERDEFGFNSPCDRIADILSNDRRYIIVLVTDRQHIGNLSCDKIAYTYITNLSRLHQRRHRFQRFFQRGFVVRCMHIVKSLLLSKMSIA